MRILLIIFSIFLASCSTSNSRPTESTFSSIQQFQPYSLEVSAESTQVATLLREYLNQDLSKLLKLDKKGKSTITVIFATHDQENDYAKWQNSTMLMVIKDESGNRLWTGEYNYKGGMELSSFTVSSPAEAAKLVSERIVQQLVSDYSL